jgi:hypothetical protein
MQVLASGASATAAASSADAGASVTKRAGSISAMQPLPAILAEPVGKRRSLPPLPHQQVSYKHVMPMCQMRRLFLTFSCLCTSSTPLAHSVLGIVSWASHPGHSIPIAHMC